MLYYKLNGYEDFKHRFGLESRNNGTTVRKNRILLGHPIQIIKHSCKSTQYYIYIG